MIIDGKNAVLGRLSTVAAKGLKSGDSVVVVNADKIIITGNRQAIVNKYTERKRRGSLYKGPYFHSSPDGIVKRAIRGMVAYKTSRGRDAMKKLRIFVGVPQEYEGKEMTKVQKPVNTSFIYMENLAQSVGWRK